jgi:hypothetical protein
MRMKASTPRLTQVPSKVACIASAMLDFPERGAPFSMAIQPGPSTTPMIPLRAARTSPTPRLPLMPVEPAAQPRYRCDACGNLTRFDVTTTQTTKAFHHYTVGGELELEDEQVLAHNVDQVVCRWCGHGRSVVEITEDEQGPQSAVS